MCGWEFLARATRAETPLWGMWTSQSLAYLYIWLGKCGKFPKSSQNSLNRHRKKFPEGKGDSAGRGAVRKMGTNFVSGPAVTGQGECFQSEGFGLI